MLNWLTRQRQQLHGFYRDGFGRAFGMTALAFAVVMVVSYLVTLRYPAPIERLIKLFREQIADRGIMDTTGRVDVLALFGNNVRATVFSIVYGFIPFIYLPALSIGINSLLLGLFAGVYVNNGISLLAYFAGIVPHGIFELPALILALSQRHLSLPQGHRLRPAQQKGRYGSPDEGSAAPVRHAHHPPAGGSGGDRGLCDTRSF